MQLSFLDWFVLALYFLLSIGIGGDLLGSFAAALEFDSRLAFPDDDVCYGNGA